MALTDPQLLDLAETLAREAAATILAVRARGFQVRSKADASPVTEADQAAEALIVAGLRAATPDLPVVAEEEFSDGIVAPQGSTYWLVDPLDGTREFARGSPDFCVNIGLVRDGAAVLGVVALPAHEEVFGGIVGQGAFKRRGEARRAISARDVPLEGPTVMASRHRATDPELLAFLRTVPAARIVNVGSAVKFMRLAEGVADLYPRLGETMEWDTAAPQAVLEAAGGSVRLMADGAALRYGKPGWVNPSFLCRGL